MRLMRSELTILSASIAVLGLLGRRAGGDGPAAVAVSGLRGWPLVLSVRVVWRGGSEPRAGRRGLVTRATSFGARESRAAGG